MKIIWIVVIGIFLFGSALPLQAEGVTRHQMGEILLKEIWDAVQAKNMNLLNQKIADEFQSLDQDGARNRTQELDFLQGLNITSRVFSDVKATRRGALLIVTYMLEMNGGVPSPCLSVFMQQPNNTWLWVAQAQSV